MRGHPKPVTRERLEYMWSILKKGPTETGYAYFRARRRRKNLRDDGAWLEEWDRIPLEERGRFDISAEELDVNERMMLDYANADSAEIRSVQWFLPWVPTVFLGGVYTILRFSAHLAREHGVESRFCIYDVAPKTATRMVEGIHAAFPELAKAEVTFRRNPDGRDDYSHLRECDAAIATFWTSAFPVLRFPKARMRFYFVQDFEPYFYPASSAFALAEETYRFGFPGIVNTPGLAEAYRAYGNPAVSFEPAVDLERYHPPPQPRPESPVRVFFYGRPYSSRNGFGLGLASLGELKDKYGDRVEIICAGESWNPGQFGYAGTVSNLGRLRNMDEVADLYRTCHIGLVLMFTKHPSYQPFEFMATRVACVSNHNPATEWFLRDGENCLVARPLPSAIADRIGELVESPDLRQRITETALARIREVRWDEQIEHAWRAITKQSGALTTADAGSATAARPPVAPRG